jgi:hypothetical protein
MPRQKYSAHRFSESAPGDLILMEFEGVATPGVVVGAASGDVKSVARQVLILGQCAGLVNQPMIMEITDDRTVLNFGNDYELEFDPMSSALTFDDRLGGIGTLSLNGERLCVRTRMQNGSTPHHVEFAYGAATIIDGTWPAWGGVSFSAWGIRLQPERAGVGGRLIFSWPDDFKDKAVTSA